MVGPGGDYRQRLETLMGHAQETIEQQAPGVLDKMAAAARNIAQRLDDMASEARQRAEAGEAAPEPAGPEPGATSDRVPEPPDEPPVSPNEPPAASAGESSTAA